MNECMFAEYENEENVLVCLRIIIELHKQFRPAHSQGYFLNFLFCVAMTVKGKL